MLSAFVTSDCSVSYLKYETTLVRPRDLADLVLVSMQNRH
mgnify:CR=1 FL=1